MTISKFTSEELRNELNRRDSIPKIKSFGDDWPKSPINLWKITTEGDCEGRSINHIATERGHFAELALKYSGYTCYTLTIEPVTPTNDDPNPRDDVSVTFGSYSNATKGMNMEEKILSVSDWLGDDYDVTIGNYNGVKITKSS